MIPPVAGDSWVLDLDSFKQDATVADPGTVMAVVQKLADINYDYFQACCHRRIPRVAR